jgi:hypothetical protein
MKLLVIMFVKNGEPQRSRRFSAGLMPADPGMIDWG